jgi:hypothetical protein
VDDSKVQKDRVPYIQKQNKVVVFFLLLEQLSKERKKSKKKTMRLKTDKNQKIFCILIPFVETISLSSTIFGCFKDLRIFISRIEVTGNCVHETRYDTIK